MLPGAICRRIAPAAADAFPALVLGGIDRLLPGRHEQRSRVSSPGVLLGSSAELPFPELAPQR
jgi:hypothetical protein